MKNYIASHNAGPHSSRRRRRSTVDSRVQPSSLPSFVSKRFEEELIRMVSNIEMRSFNNNLQDRMKEDIQRERDKGDDSFLFNTKKIKVSYSTCPT